MKSLYSRLNNGQRLSIIAVFLVVIGGLFGIVRWQKERDFRPLYSGLSGEDSGAVLARLKESGTEYRVGDGGMILVPSAKVAELRLQFAASGIPKSGRIGFELFDKTTFGATEFTEQVNYQRALEGELERSVISLAEVESARVHITAAKNSIFTDNRQDAKASVIVRLRPTAHLSQQNVNAITQMVASAVEGLKPEGVSVVDMDGNLLSRPRKSVGEEGNDVSDATLDYRQRIERDLLAKVNGTLEPLLGADKFKAGVSVECDFTGGEQSEEVFDPTKSVMVTSQKTEDISGGAIAGGVPGTASSLPRPTSRPSQGGTGVTRRTENISFQTSRTVRRLRIPQGTVKRVSISVLVDHAVRWQGTGAKAKRVLEAPSPEKLKAIKDVVAGVTGFQPERGDQIIVESLPFESSSVAPPPPNELPAPNSSPRPGFSLDLHDPKTLGIVGAIAAVLLLAFVFAVKGMRPAKKVTVEVAGELPSPGQKSEDTHAEVKRQLEEKIAEQQALKDRQELEALAALKAPQVKTQKTEVLTKHLSSQVKQDPAAIASVLRTWLSEK